MKLDIKIVFIMLIVLVPLFGQDSTITEQLQERIRILEEKMAENELQQLLHDAETVVQEADKITETKVFSSGQQSMQALNPEISLASDIYGMYVANRNGFTETDRSGAHLRVAELQIEGILDPFSRAKVIFEFSPEGVGFAEGYLTWTNIFTDLSLTVGKFRQQFGVVNRWHEHGLDQFDFPLALTTILGDEGLNQTGLSFDWLMPPILADAHSLILQLTNAENDHLFAGEFFSFPAALLRFTSYFDLSAATYLELGFSAMTGKNNFRGYDEQGELILEPDQRTNLAGLDLSLLWEPAKSARYRSFLWRSEFYYAKKEIPGSMIKAAGAYTYGEYKFDASWQAGLRLDYTQPFEPDNKSKYLYQVVPYLNWWQSPWVKMRLQFNYLDGNNDFVPDRILRLQFIWAVGPHKHDRY